VRATTHPLVGNTTSPSQENLQFPPSTVKCTADFHYRRFIAAGEHFVPISLRRRARGVADPDDSSFSVGDTRSSPATCHPPPPCHLAVDSSVGAFFILDPSTLSYSEIQQCSSTPHTSTLPPPLPLTVDECHHRADVATSTLTCH
jgi:hypothetical protein